MALEIERKFLISKELFPVETKGLLIRQGYLMSSPEKSIRVRLQGDQGFLTIKGPDIQGVRDEFEYMIPVDDAISLLDDFCEEGRIIKIRRTIMIGSHLWEIDEFLGDNAGLWLAEVELDSRDEYVNLPPWIDTEVTGDIRYFNTYLAQHPFSSW